MLRRILSPRQMPRRTAGERAGVREEECRDIHRIGKSKRGLSVCGCPHATNLILDFETVRLHQLEKGERQPIVASLRVVWRRCAQGLRQSACYPPS